MGILQVSKLKFRKFRILEILNFYPYFNSSAANSDYKWASHEKTCLRGFPRRLISAFVIRFLESIISNLATNEISIF